MKRILYRTSMGRVLDSVLALDDESWDESEELKAYILYKVNKVTSTSLRDMYYWLGINGFRDRDLIDETLKELEEGGAIEGLWIS